MDNEDERSTTLAAERLVELGLTEYEARCFVALLQLSDGTAKEVSQIADVPQSRVYDVAAELHERGLVDVQESEPRRYYAVPAEQALDRLRREYGGHLESASDRLEELEARESDTNAVWQMANREDVRLRIGMHLEDAQEEIYLHLGDEATLEEDVLDRLSEAVDEGIDVVVEVQSDAARDRLHDADPGIQVGRSTLALAELTDEDRSPGRLLMVDRETILMSAITGGLVPGETEETGLWSTEVDHGLVVWIRPLLEARIDALDRERAEPA